jgi:predicted nucleotidyltransferase component of viral defense system
MNELGKYYRENLYPLQNGVLRRLESIHSPFYLTGGTLLGREYIGHRYSDDLDFFVNEDPGYLEYVQRAFASIKKSQDELGYSVPAESSLFTERYSRFFLETGIAQLKLDFVNDIAFRLDDIGQGDIYYRIDSIRNVLSNKISALYRFEPKDIADVWGIAKNYKFHWEDIFQAAKKKDAGVDVKNACEILLGFPKKMFSRIKWQNPPPEEKFFADLEKIVKDMLEVSENKLV